MKFTKVFAVIILLVILHSFSVQSQVPVLGSEVLLDKLRLNKAANGNETTLYADINGNPYLFKEFKKGQLFLNSGEKFEVLVRYDMYANEMNLKNKGEVYAIIYPEKVKSIDVDSLKFIYSPFVNSAGEEPAKVGGYFIVKTDGKCKLLVKKNVRIQDAELPKLYVDAKPAKFIPSNDTFYLKLNEKNAIKIRNENDLLSILGDQKALVTRFIKENRLGAKKVEDLSRIIKYYNGL